MLDNNVDSGFGKEVILTVSISVEIPPPVESESVVSGVDFPVVFAKKLDVLVLTCGTAVAFEARLSATGVWAWLEAKNGSHKVSKSKDCLISGNEFNLHTAASSHRIIIAEIFFREGNVGWSLSLEPSRWIIVPFHLIIGKPFAEN